MIINPNSLTTEGDQILHTGNTHANLHAKDGSDPITPESIGAVDVIINLRDEVDLNTVVNSGFYRMATSQVVNGPSGENVGWGQLIVCRGGDTIGQIIITHGTNKMFFRGGYPPEIGGSGTWNAWKEVETPSGAQSKVDTHANKKTTHGLGSGYYLAKTSRSDQLPAWGDIQGKPSTFSPSSHSHPWSEVTGKPSSYTPSSHSHSWSEVTGKPSSYTPSSHKNSHASDGSDPITPASIGAETPTGAQAKVTTHENKTSTHGATATPTANRIAMYDSDKRLSSGAAPTSDNHVVRKIDMEALKKHSLIYLGESIGYGGAIYAIAVDNDYVYVGGTITQKVYKLYKSNLSKAAESIDYGGAIRAIAVDNDYVYVGGEETRRVYKLNKSNLTKVAESGDYGGPIYAIAVDNDFVYIGGGSTQKVYKLKKSDLSKAEESDNYGGAIRAIAVDNDFSVYVGGESTKKVYKLNKAFLSKVTESDGYGGTIQAIAIDDEFVYVGGESTKKVYKFKQSILTKVAESGNYGGVIYTIAVDDDYVYVGGTVTQKVYKLKKSDLSKAAESINYGGATRAIAVDDDFVYAGGLSTQKVYKLLNIVSLKN